MGEGGFQIGVSQLDIQGIGIVERIRDKVGDAGLTCRTSVVEIELLLTREAITEIDSRRRIDYGAAYVVMLPTLVVVHRIDLRLHIASDSQLILGTVDAELQAGIMVLIGVGGIVALSGIRHAVIRELAIIGPDDSIEVVVGVENGADSTIIVSKAVAIGVAQLEVNIMGYRLIVANISTPIAILGL